MDGAFKNAKWIGGGESFSGNKSAARHLRAKFSVNKKCAGVTARVSGLGLFEAYLNGERLSDMYFAPYESDYSKHVYYFDFDITDKVNVGENDFEIVLGNGQYVNFIENPTMERDGTLIEPHRYQKNDGWVKHGIHGRKKAIAVIFSEDETLLESNDTWETFLGATVFQSWYGGEDYDRTFIPEISRASVMTPPEGGLNKYAFAPITIKEKFPPIGVTRLDDGHYIVDFGKNGAGFPELRLKNMTENERGTVIKMLPCEELTEDGHADQRSCTQSWSETKKCEISDRYTVGGIGDETWHPHFCYHGFRYLEVIGFPGEPKRENFAYCRIMTANPKEGYFTTDNDVLDAINALAERSIESNMQSTFTDCPQIEKLGWIETTHLMFDSLAYGWDLRGWMPKIINDIIDSQLNGENGEGAGFVPAIIPEFQRIVGLHRDPNWNGACIFTPWKYYRFYGDAAVLSAAYPTMKNYIAHLEKYEKGGLLSNYAQMGDWGEINEHTPKKLVENCAYYSLVVTVSKTAAALGQHDDAQKYLEKSEAIRAAFHNDKECFSNGVYGNGSQASCGCALFCGIVPEKGRNAAFDALVSAIGRDNFHFTSGEVGLKQVLSVLNRFGRDDLAYKMITNPNPPSYRYFVDEGLTTLPEYWNYKELWWGMVRSRNHAMMGHVREWLVNAVLGVRSDEDFNSVTIKPFVPDKTTYAEGSFLCGRGRVTVKWRVSGNKIKIDAAAPDNVQLKILPPYGFELTL